MQYSAGSPGRLWVTFFALTGLLFTGVTLLHLDASPIILAPRFELPDGRWQAEGPHSSPTIGQGQNADHPSAGSIASPPSSFRPRPSDVVLLLPPETAEAPHAGRTDTSTSDGFASSAGFTGWYNFVTQSFGYVRVVRDLTPDVLLQTRLLIIPEVSLATLTMPPELLANAVAQGMGLVLEVPTRFPVGANLRNTASPPNKAGPDSPSTSQMTHFSDTTFAFPQEGWSLLSGLDLTAFGGSTHEAPLKGSLLTALELPQPVRRSEVRTAPLPPATRLPDPDEVQPLLSFQHGPALSVVRRGLGAVYTAYFRLGAFLQYVQQGSPDADNVLRNRYIPRQSLPLETSDLVVDSALLTARWPVIDLLEDALADDMATRLGLPRLWLFPAAAPGALLVTHDEESMGDKALWMAEADAAQGCTSTNYIVPGPAFSTQALARLDALGADIGLHTILTGTAGELYPGTGLDLEGRFQAYGLWKLTPVWRLFSPTEQRNWLQARMPAGKRIVTSRTHFLAWPPEHAAYFGALADAGVQLDSSYGPDIQNRGYLFGTGRPFSPAARNGLPLPILELPFVAAEDLGGATPAFIQQLLEDSAATTHQALTVLYHPNAFRWHPSTDAYRTWRGLCEQSRRLGLWNTTMTALTGFQHLRSLTPIRSRLRRIPAPETLPRQLAPSQVVLSQAELPVQGTAPQSTDSSPDPTPLRFGGTLELQLEATMEGLTLQLPRSWENGTLQSLSVTANSAPESEDGGEQAPSRALAFSTPVGADFALVPLPTGVLRITATYAPLQAETHPSRE